MNNITGTENADLLSGTNEDDNIRALGGNDTIIAGDGDDWITPGTGDDTVHGGDGADVLFYEGVYDGVALNNTAEPKNGIPAYSARSSDGLYQDSFSNIENFHLSYGDDLFYADANGYVFMRSGDDTAYITDASVLIIPGSGSDTIIADTANPSSLGYFYDSFDRPGVADPTITNGISVSYDGNNPTSLSGQVIDGWGDTDTFSGINRMEGTDLADTMSAEGVDQSIRFEGLDGNDILSGGDGDDTLDGGEGDDKLYGGAGEDHFWGGAGDDSITFGADTITGEATRGWYYSEAGNDQINMGNEWGWLRYNEFAGAQRALINFTGDTVFFVEEAVVAGSDFITLSSSSPQGDSNVAVTELDSFSVRDQFGDVDSYLNTEDGAHFWGTALDDVFVTSKHFWWSATAGNDQIIVIGDEGGTLEAPWESGVNWSLANTSFAYIGEDGNNYTISLVQGSLSGLAGGEGDDTLTGTAADERFNPHAGDNVVTGGGGWDTYRFNDADGHTLITDYATGERIQFDAERIGFDVSNLNSEITTEYSDATDQTKLYVQSATVARHHIATVNGEFVIANREYDARWDDVNVQLVEAELQGDNTIVGTDEDDTLYGFDGNDVLDGRGGEDRFWGGAGDDSITFGADTVTGEATRGDYYSEAGNDQIDMGGEWGWLRYDEVAGSQRALINFTGETLFFVEEAVSAGSNFITTTSSAPQGYSNVVVTELDSFSVRDQFGDVDIYLNTNDGAHFWGTALDDVFVTSNHFWWSATAGNDQLIVIGDEGGTLDAPLESAVNWSLENTSFAYIGEDGNSYTISLIEGSLSGLAGGDGDDTLTGTDADERFNPDGGNNVVTGGGGWDSFRFWDADGHTLITDYATGERIQFEADRIGFDVDNLTSEITTEYDDATDQTKLYVQSATVALHHIASVNGEFVIASREYDARWGDVNVTLIASVDGAVVGVTPDFLGVNTTQILDNWFIVQSEAVAKASGENTTFSIMQTVDGAVALLSDGEVLAIGDVDVDDVNSSGEVYWNIWFDALEVGIGGWNRATETQNVLSLTENGVQFTINKQEDDIEFNELLLRFKPPSEVDLTGTVAENFDFLGVAYIQSEIWYNDFDGDGKYSTYDRAKFIPRDSTGDDDWDSKISVEDRNGQLVMKDADYNDIGISWVSTDFIGDNIITGTDSDDELFGFAGNDTIYGMGGDDWLSGGAGNDTLTGGEGADTFVFQGAFDHDVITDFDETEDSLEFYSADGSAIAVSEMIERTDTNGNRVLLTSDGLSSVTFGAMVSPPVVDPAFDIVLTSESDGIASFAIYANELVDPDSDGIGSFEFTLSHDPSDLLIDIDSFSAASGISGVPNYNATTGILEAAAFAFPNFTNLTAPIVTFSATILDSDNPLNLAITDAIVDRVAQDDVVETFDFSSVEVESTIIGRGAEALAGVRVSYDFVTPSGQQKTIELPAQAASKVSQAMERGVDLTVTADKSIDTASDKAIGAYDALQALRLAVGLDKSDGTAEWHDYLAADINKDGRVGADDALDILKYAVGLTDGSSADWIFVDGDADWSGVDRRNTDYDEGVMLEDVLVDTSINMTGILVGDLDGSYLA